ncbi:maltose alpha-D-glucosyltransferase [Aestuariimicrobium kwangyangense]|uniref:maltose alpha-D-glucosyltransferase n=1 Tax=Aestuariimicrobium kwangyangense TaxID=396389 RepID=UPI0003B5E808|nr:maltose alpha-D-glucosyltransferase [Aestuariimicrobium kwangyangense]
MATDDLHADRTPDEALVDDFFADLSFDSQRFAARPAKLRPRAMRRQPTPDTIAPPPFEADGRNAAYVAWLVDQSMLKDATVLARQLAGHASMWSNPYAQPDPRAALDKAQVWFAAYPLALVTRTGESFLSALGSDDLWAAFEQIGIDAVHTGPVKLAGGISGWTLTPSVDGHFDRISMVIDPIFGTEDEFRDMCESAARHHGTIIDDVVPGHTGKGADFRLAEANYQDYPGIYHMVSIPEDAWPLLPEVPEGHDSVNLDAETEAKLAEEGYIIGALQRVIFYEPGVKETNWSVTRVVHGVDGVARRWVYLHYFKDGQPSVNWLDPTFAGMRMVMGDALHSLTDLGSGGLRLDANGFLGVEKRVEELAWSEGHPLSQAANQLIGSMVRKVGGFTFQELNLAMDDILATGSVGPDLSYDFVTRPGYHVALLTADTEFLRLTLNESLALGIDQASLVHAMQNHDELTYELVHFESAHAHDTYRLAGQEYTGRELAEHVRQTMRQTMAGDAAPYNALFVQNGIACTTASVITAALGITDLSTLDDDQVAQIKDAHLLLAKYNAWQPGVFALSGWDLVGALPLERQQVQSLIATGDTRWIERGAYDLMGASNPGGTPTSGMPMARSLYGSLPAQLDDESSFVRRLAEVLTVRRRHGLATGTLLEVPEVEQPCVLVMVSRLAVGAIQVTVLNFSASPVTTHVASEYLPQGRVLDLAARRTIGRVEITDTGTPGFKVTLPAFGGRAVIIKE